MKPNQKCTLIPLLAMSALTLTILDCGETATPPPPEEMVRAHCKKICPTAARSCRGSSPSLMT